MRDVSLTGAQVPSMPGGMSGFQRLNMSDGSAARSSCQPPSRIRPNTVMRTEPTMRMIVCTASVYATPRIPPATVYSPVSTTTATEPTQKLLKVAPPRCNRASGSRVAKTTPPAKMPTANLVST